MKKTILFLVLPVLFACSSKNDLTMDRSPKEFHGKMFAGEMAIGGETTGFILEATNGNTYELYMKNTGKLAKFHNKNVKVIGRATEASGVEVLKRNIIEVTEIQEE